MVAAERGATNGPMCRSCFVNEKVHVSFSHLNIITSTIGAYDEIKVKIVFVGFRSKPYEMFHALLLVLMNSFMICSFSVRINTVLIQTSHNSCAERVN
jgi:hypothetical protein